MRPLASVVNYYSASLNVAFHLHARLREHILRCDYILCFHDLSHLRFNLERRLLLPSLTDARTPSESHRPQVFLKIIFLRLASGL